MTTSRQRPHSRSGAEVITLARRMGLAVGIALVAACGPTASSTPVSPHRPTGFPAECRDDEVQVMLLGTYHMANPGRDVIRQEFDDVLAPRRQRELADLASQLVEWRPDQLAVEVPFADSTRLQQRYDAYLADTLPPDRDEVVQVAFRVARALGHSRVYGIDAPMELGGDSLTALLERRPDVRRHVEQVTGRLQQSSDSLAPVQRGATIGGWLTVLNSEDQLHGGNSFGMFGAMMPAGEAANYGGPDLIAQWYRRNIRMVHHLHRTRLDATRRILVVVGAGHVPPLRGLIDEDPRLCPVSPLPLLGRH